MPLSRRLLYSSLLAVALAILLVASSVSAMTAYGYSSQNQAPTQTGWDISWTILTGPATIPPQLGGPLQLQSMLSTGSCQLTGMVPGMNVGMSGECHILAIVNAEGQAPSVCQASFALGSSPELPAAWAAVPTQDSALPMFYGITNLNGQLVQDFRVSSSSLLTPHGFNTALCSAFLFEGYSADTFVPAQAGHFDFSGTQGLFGTFWLYTANVHAIYSHGHGGN